MSEATLYQISGDTCGQSTLNANYVKYAKIFQSGLQDGTCASQGYTQETTTTSINVPVVGKISVAEYTKA